jgi:predicted amidohydrolase
MGVCALRDQVKVTAVQMDVRWQDVEANRARMTAGAEEAASAGSHLVLFPELANTGYFRFGDLDFIGRYVRLAETIPGPTTEALGAVARRRGLHIIVGLLEAHPRIPGAVFNSAALIGPAGRLLGVHRKVHLGIDEKKVFFAGDRADVYRTDLGNLAMMVCYDGVMPELSRVMALKGAEILCGVYAAPGWIPGGNRRLEHIAGMRARENGAYYVLCNRVGRQEDWQFIGGTTIAAPNGEILAQDATTGEAFVHASLSGDLLIRTRVEQTIFRDRRPELYTLLCESLSAARWEGDEAADPAAHRPDLAAAPRQ